MYQSNSFFALKTKQNKNHYIASPLSPQPAGRLTIQQGPKKFSRGGSINILSLLRIVHNASLASHQYLFVHHGVVYKMRESLPRTYQGYPPLCIEPEHEEVMPLNSIRISRRVYTTSSNDDKETAVLHEVIYFHRFLLSALCLFLFFCSKKGITFYLYLRMASDNMITPTITHIMYMDNAIASTISIILSKKQKNSPDYPPPRRVKPEVCHSTYVGKVAKWQTRSLSVRQFVSLTFGKLHYSSLYLYLLCHYQGENIPHTSVLRG